jgi:transmembrane sensor
MTNIHPINLPPKRQTAQQTDPLYQQTESSLEQACLWVARLDRGLQDDEQPALQQWLAAHPAHRSQLLAAAKQWDQLDALRVLADLFPEAQTATSTPAARPQSWLGRHSKALAASVLLCSVLGLVAGQWPLLQAYLTGGASQIASQTSYQTRVGESATIDLADHSKLVLNTNSFVVVRYTPEARIIELQRGEITIDVAHDSSRPLSVLAAGKVIQAVGTAFNVDLRKDSVELIVTEGIVRVAPALQLPAKGEQPLSRQLTQRLPADALALGKGERVALDPAGKKPEQVERLDANALAAKLSWRSGNLIFRGEALEDVLQEISRYTEVQFELADDDKLKQIQVAGLFKAGDVNGLLEVFRHNFNISYERLSRDKILLKYAG